MSQYTTPSSHSLSATIGDGTVSGIVISRLSSTFAILLYCCSLWKRTGKHFHYIQNPLKRPTSTVIGFLITPRVSEKEPTYCICASFFSVAACRRGCYESMSSLGRWVLLFVQQVYSYIPYTDCYCRLYGMKGMPQWFPFFFFFLTSFVGVICLRVRRNTPRTQHDQ